MKHRLGAYAVAPELAFSGWRLRVPGNPAGGQYHGYTAPDAAGTPDQSDPAPLSGYVDEIWGGTALAEGDTLSDHVYRSPGEVRPRANASGHANVLPADQTRRTAGYAEAPGNYAALGISPYRMDRNGGDFRIPVNVVALRPAPRPLFPVVPQNGATAIVAQPPPPNYPVSSPAVVASSIVPVSPTPSPTVAATAADYLPSNGISVPGITPGAVDTSTVLSMDTTAAPTDFSAWLDASTIVAGVKNQWIALAGAVFVFKLFSSESGGRRR